MKRFFILFLILSIVVSLVVFSASAYQVDGRPNDAFNVEEGRLYGKIVNWQNYVTSSNEGTLPNVTGSASGEVGWVTTVDLPDDSIWELSDFAGALNTPWYTNGGNSGSFYVDSRNIGVYWKTPYFLDIEDLRKDEASVLRMSFQIPTNTEGIAFSSISVYAYFYDVYKNYIGDVELGHHVGNGDTYITTYDTFYLSTEWIDAGCKYIQFSADIVLNSHDVGSSVTIWRNEWELLLPVQFDPERFAVDGLDAWMNGYFKPIVPDDGSGGLWEHFTSNIKLLREMTSQVTNFLSTLGTGFLVWNTLFGRFMAVGWINNLFSTCVLLGSIAFFFGIAVNVASGVGSSARRSARRASQRRQQKKDKKSSKEGG